MNKVENRPPITKRVFDIVFSVIILTILSPFLLLITLMTLISNGIPILFKQQRPGVNGKPFEIIKYRTMNDKRDKDGVLLPDAKRITKIGKVLRLSSLDEIPEFINVIKGEMSIVGPRPLLMQYLDRYSQEQARRHEMLPGITGWAQIHGRNAISWEEKFSLDVWYVDNWSFWLDIKIILITIWKVITGEGISQPGRATMDEFMGDS